MSQARFRYIFCSFFLHLLAVATVHAYDIDPVANLQLDFRHDGSAMVDVRWDAQNYPVDVYSVFTGFGEAGHMRFAAICRKSHFEMPIRQAGRFYVMVLAQSGNRISEPAIVHIDISAADLNLPTHEDYVLFHSAAPTSAIVGQHWQYQPDASELEGKKLHYELIENPQGMTIDHKSGQIDWMPQAPGTYDVHLRAYAAVDDHIEGFQQWQIVVLSAQDNPLHACAKVDVNVVLPNQQALYEGKVTAVRVERGISAREMYAVRATDVVSATLEKGLAQLDLAAGEYLFSVSGAGIKKTWNGGTTHPGEARVTRVVCAEGSAQKQCINIQAIEREYELGRRIIRGQVRDAENAAGNSLPCCISARHGTSTAGYLQRGQRIRRYHGYRWTL